MADDLRNIALKYQLENNLYSFSRYAYHKRTGGKWVRNWHHELICQKLEAVFRGEIKRLIINIPPRYSKTDIAVIYFIAWCLAQVPDCEFIHTSYTASLAISNAAKVRDIVSSDWYQQLFDTRLDGSSTAKGDWKTTAGGTLYSAGSGGAITGFGAGKMRQEFGGAIIIDDPHKADDARSEVMRSNVIEWYQNTLQSRTNSPDTPIIVIMQRLHEDDLAGWLLSGKNGEAWEHLCLPAIQPDGAALWEYKHSLDDLKRLETASPYMFAGQYMQSPAPLDGGVIKPSMIQIVDAIPAGSIQWVRGWDLAASIDGDYTAGGKLGKLPDGRWIIGDMVREQMASDERDAAIRNTAARDGHGVKVSIPQDPGAAGKTLALHLTRMLAGYNVKTSPETGDKVTRSEPLAAQINVGNVMMLKGSWNDALINEMRMFPNGKYDDQVDALSRAFGELLTSNTPTIGKLRF